MNFLKNKPVDRVPVAFFHHYCRHDDWYMGLERPEAFEDNIRYHREARAVFDPDVVKIMNDTLMIMPVDISFVKKPSDLRSIHAPGPDSVYFQKARELTKRVMEIYGDTDAPIYATGFSTSLVLRSAFRRSTPALDGEKYLLDFLKEDPDSVLCGMNNLVDGIARFHEMLIKECGADGIYLSVNNQASFFDDEFYRSKVAPYDKAALNEANKLSDMNLLHICGYHGLSNNLSLFTDFEAAAYNIAVYAEGISLSEGKKLFSGKPVFGGFSQDGVIYRGSRKEVTDTAWNILDECGQTGVMLGADCTTPTDIDDDRFNWVRDAAVAYANGEAEASREERKAALKKAPRKMSV